MAEERCSARLLRRIAEAALRMREPARHAAGSVAAAAIVSAICVGIYNIVISTIYFSESYNFYYGMDGLLATAGGLASITTLADAALIFGVLRRKKEYLHFIVSAALSLYLLCGLMPLCVVFGHAYNMQWSYMLWEVPRLVLYPLHTCIVYCLLAEVREDKVPDESAAPPAYDWFKNNLENSSHVPLGAGELQKLQADRRNDPAPVHIGPEPSPVPPSGPLTSSEA